MDNTYLSRLVGLVGAFCLAMGIGTAEARPIRLAAPEEPAGSKASENGAEKSGRFMFNLKIGPALCAVSAISRGSASASAECGSLHQGALVFDFGWSVLPNRNAYLLFPFQLQFRESLTTVMIPVGFQYDIQLPVKGLYLYPRGFLGYAAFVVSNSSIPGVTVSSTSHYGVFTPEFGIKYIFGGRWNVGADLFSLPIFFGQSQGATSTFVYYRILAYAGVNF